MEILPLAFVKFVTGLILVVGLIAALTLIAEPYWAIVVAASALALSALLTVLLHIAQSVGHQHTTDQAPASLSE